MLEKFRNGIVGQFFDSRVQIARPAQAQKHSSTEKGLRNPQGGEKQQQEEKPVGGVRFVNKGEQDRQKHGKGKREYAHPETFLNLLGADVAERSHCYARAGEKAGFNSSSLEKKRK